MKATDFDALMRGHVSELFKTRWAPLLPFCGKSIPAQAGVYVLAFSVEPLNGLKIHPRHVLYVGMSNSLEGIRGRLRQFAHSVEGNFGHSGGNRFFNDYLGEVPLSEANKRKKFYVSYLTLPCTREKAERTRNDLRIMGHVACLEYYVMAHIKHATGDEPKLNVK